MGVAPTTPKQIINKVEVNSQLYKVLFSIRGVIYLEIVAVFDYLTITTEGDEVWERITINRPLVESKGVSNLDNTYFSSRMNNYFLVNEMEAIIYEALIA